jgi:DNA-3-methyladenine glycosylase
MGGADTLKSARRGRSYVVLIRSELPNDTASLARFLIGKTLMRELPEGFARFSERGQDSKVCPPNPSFVRG